MRLAIFFKTLRDLRWQVAGYGLGLALLAAIVIFIYPSYSSQLDDFEIPEALKGFMGEEGYTTPKGFISAEFFSFAPAVLCIFAIMAGTAALGGEEANGTLELLLAQPVSRRRLVLEKMFGLVACTFAIIIVTAVGWLLSVPFVDIDISYGALLLATAGIAPLALAFEAIALWATAALPDRKLATGIVTLVAIVSYLAAYLASVVDVLAPLRWASLFHYHDGTNALSHGLHPGGTVVLLLVTAVFAFLTLLAFERREIGSTTASFALPWRRRTVDAAKEPA
ncbi:MAG: ABC transporter permease subunit [Dehalococcoidia bacterium]